MVGHCLLCMVEMIQDSVALLNGNVDLFAVARFLV